MQFREHGGGNRWHMSLANSGADLNFSETGVADQRLYLKAGGNVGIGTNNPSTKLEVNDTLTATTFAGSGASLTSIPESAVTNLTTDLTAKASLSMGAAMMDSTRKRPFFYCDFLQSASAAALDPFVGTGPGGGTFSAPNAGLVTAHHPGVLKLKSSTTTNSGYLIGTSVNELFPGEDEVFEAVFNLTTLALSTFRFGFHDATARLIRLTRPISRLTHPAWRLVRWPQTPRGVQPARPPRSRLALGTGQRL